MIVNSRFEQTGFMFALAQARAHNNANSDAQRRAIVKEVQGGTNGS
jgi:hypothetical protein